MREILSISALFMILLILTSCQQLNITDGEQSSTKNASYIFYDEAVQAEVEKYFDKTVDELTEEDFVTLTQFKYFTISSPVETLKDIPNLFPNLNFISLSFNNALMLAENCEIVSNLKNLKAVKIYSPELPSLDFIENLTYVEIMYSDEEVNNLATASVLGADFINAKMTGNIKNYVRLVSDETIFELFHSDYIINDGEFDEYLETKVVVSKNSNGNYIYDTAVDVIGRIGNASGGLHTVDVNFDGNQDILVKNGHFGNQGLVTYSCFLYRDSNYEYCPSFSDIPNVSVDKDNKKLLSVWRNWAASHSWAMYSFVDGEFVMTDLMTEELDTEEKDDDIWIYSVEQLIGGEMQETDSYSTKDYSKEQIDELFYDENSHWGLLSDKWKTLNNLGSMIGFSIYGGDDVNATIYDIVGD